MYGPSDEEQSSDEDDGELENIRSREIMESDEDDVLIWDRESAKGSGNESDTVFEETLDQSTVTTTTSFTTVVVKDEQESDIDTEVPALDGSIRGVLVPYAGVVDQDDDPISVTLADALADIETTITRDTSDTSDTGDDDTDTDGILKPTDTHNLEGNNIPATNAPGTTAPRAIAAAISEAFGTNDKESTEGQLEAILVPTGQDSEKDTSHDHASSSDDMTASDAVLELDDLALVVDDNQILLDDRHSQSTNDDDLSTSSASIHDSSIKLTEFAEGSREDQSTPTASKQSSELHLDLLTDTSLSSVPSIKVTSEPDATHVQRRRPVSAQLARPLATAISHSNSFDQLSSCIPLVSVSSGGHSTYGIPEMSAFEKFNTIVSHDSLVISEASHMTRFSDMEELKLPEGLTLDEKLEYTLKKVQQF